MPDHEGSETPSGSRAPEAGQPSPELDLAAALGGLDRATKDFTRRLGEAQGIAARAAALQSAAPAIREAVPTPAAPAQPAPPRPRGSLRSAPARGRARGPPLSRARQAARRQPRRVDDRRRRARGGGDPPRRRGGNPGALAADRGRCPTAPRGGDPGRRRDRRRAPAAPGDAQRRHHRQGRGALRRPRGRRAHPDTVRGVRAGTLPDGGQDLPAAGDGQRAQGPRRAARPAQHPRPSAIAA